MYRSHAAPAHDSRVASADGVAPVSAMPTSGQQRGPSEPCRVLSVWSPGRREIVLAASHRSVEQWLAALGELGREPSVAYPLPRHAADKPS